MSTMVSKAQEDLLVSLALVRFSHEFQTANPKTANRAWKLAIEYAGRQGLRPAEVDQHIQWNN